MLVTLSCFDENEYILSEGKSSWQGTTINNEYFELEIVIENDTLHSIIIVPFGPPHKWRKVPLVDFHKNGYLGTDSVYRFSSINESEGIMTLANNSDAVLYKFQNYLDSDFLSNLECEYNLFYRRALCMGLDSFTFNSSRSNHTQKTSIKSEIHFSTK